MKSSEKLLLTLFGVALFVVANLIGEQVFARKKDEAKEQIKAHQLNLARYEGQLAFAQNAGKRRSWLGKVQPSFVSEESAASELEAHIKGSADIAGAELERIVPNEPDRSQPGWVIVSFTVRGKGTPEDVTRFVSQLQSREGFVAVPRIKMDSDPRDPSILRVDGTIARWYSTETPAGGASPGGGFAATAPARPAPRPVAAPISTPPGVVPPPAASPLPPRAAAPEIATPPASVAGDADAEPPAAQATPELGLAPLPAPAAPAVEAASPVSADAAEPEPEPAPGGPRVVLPPGAATPPDSAPVATPVAPTEIDPSPDGN